MFEPETLADAYALSKLQELTITGVFWCDRKERHEDKVDYSKKDSIRNPALKTEWKLDSEMEDETYADEKIDPDAEIDVFEEEEADWDDYIEKETDVTTAEIASCQESIIYSTLQAITISITKYRVHNLLFFLIT